MTWHLTLTGGGNIHTAEFDSFEEALALAAAAAARHRFTLEPLSSNENIVVGEILRDGLTYGSYTLERI